MKALETNYRGYRFRSRLEARWAVFMDAMNVRFEYEPEAYDLDGICYLPDFWLPEMDAHLEIKGISQSEFEAEKARRLADFSGKLVFIIVGQPEPPDDYEFTTESAYVYYPDGGEDFSFWWCECRHCHRCELQFNGRASRIFCNCPWDGSKDYNYNSDRLLEAYAKARGYRFEPGAINTI